MAIFAIEHTKRKSDNSVAPATFQRQKKNYERVVDAQVPITVLPAELLARIFSVLARVNDYHSVLLVSGFWNQLADSEPHWIRFKQHFQRLAVFFPHLSLTDRKTELDRCYWQVITRADQCRKMFQRQPAIFSMTGCSLYVQNPPAHLDLVAQQLLCWHEGMLKILDVNESVLKTLRVDQYLTQETEELRPLLTEGIVQKKYSQVAWIANRFLILKFGIPHEERFLAVDTQKHHAYLFRPQEELLPENHPFTATTKLLSPFSIWKPEATMHMVFLSVHHYLSETDIIAAIHNLYCFDLEAGNLNLLVSRCDFAKGRSPMCFVSEKHVVLEHTRRAGLPTDTTLFACQTPVELLSLQEEVKRTIIGELSDSLYFLSYVKHPDLIGEVQADCIYRHFSTGKHQWFLEQISLREPLKSSFDATLISMQLFYPYFLAIVSRVDQSEFNRLSVWNLKNQECLLSIGGQDPFTIKNFTLVGDFLIFAGLAPSVGTIKLYGATLKSSHPPEEIPIPALKGDHFSFYLYKDKLILQDAEGVTILDYAPKVLLTKVIQE